MNKYQIIAGEILYLALVSMRRMNPGRYNRWKKSSPLDNYDQLTLNSEIADVIHNLPHIMMANVSESDTRESLYRELQGFEYILKNYEIPDWEAPASWASLKTRIADFIRVEGMRGQ